MQLEPYIPPFKKRIGHTIHTKNSYDTRVKMENWQYKVEPEATKRKECIRDDYITSYKTMTDQLCEKNTYDDNIQHKPIFNYFGYKDEKITAENFHSRRDFPTIMKNDHNMIPQFITTMQSSYSSPLGMVMQRVSHFKQNKSIL